MWEMPARAYGTAPFDATGMWSVSGWGVRNERLSHRWEKSPALSTGIVHSCVKAGGRNRGQKHEDQACGDGRVTAAPEPWSWHSKRLSQPVAPYCYERSLFSWLMVVLSATSRSINPDIFWHA